MERLFSNIQQASIPVGCVPPAFVVSVGKWVGYPRGGIPYPPDILPPGCPTPRCPTPWMPYPQMPYLPDTLPPGYPTPGRDLVPGIPYHQCPTFNTLPPGYPTPNNLLYRYPTSRYLTPRYPAPPDTLPPRYPHTGRNMGPEIAYPL